MRTEPIGMAVAVLFLLASGQACAGTVGELAEIQAQAILTEAKVRLATAQRQLEGKGETGQVVSAQGQTFAMPVPAPPPTITMRWDMWISHSGNSVRRSSGAWLDRTTQAR